MTLQRTDRRIPILGIVAFVLLAALLLTLAVLSTIKGVRSAASVGNVVRVEDGQTFVVNMDGTEETITLAGLMAPLPAEEGQEPTAENCLGEESAQNLEGILEPGAEVQLEYADPEDGARGTRPALVRHGGEVVNVQQAEMGLAVPLREQPIEHLGAELREARDTARNEQAGLYSPAEPCTLPGRIVPAIEALESLPSESPASSAEAEAHIETVSVAVEQGVTVEKLFDAVDPEGTSLTSLAWSQDASRLREQLGGALSAAQSELASLKSTRNVLVTREREEEAARKAEAARQAEQARQAELARQRAEAQRQAELERERAEARRKAQEEQRDPPSATPSPSKTPSESPSPSEDADSASPSPSPSKASSSSPSSPDADTESADDD